MKYLAVALCAGETGISFHDIEVLHRDANSLSFRVKSIQTIIQEALVPALDGEYIPQVRLYTGVSGVEMLYDLWVDSVKLDNGSVVLELSAR
jgi:hypothetical protein